MPQRKHFKISYSGFDLLNNSVYNKGSAFSREERQRFKLEGLLPPHISTMEEQCQRMYQSITRKQDPLEQHIGLVALQNRNEHLFLKLLHDHLEEFLPIVYTPTVGLACQRFSHIFRKVRGLWITPDHKGDIEKHLGNSPYKDIRLIVVTDNERILGLGDQGAGGMGIPVGKLSLYSVAAGIHPIHTLAISLDVGTDNKQLLEDPLYLGWRHPRLRGAPYHEIVEEFVEAVKARFPNALLQWEDFKKQNAFDLLDKFKDRLLSFNDDIQGTAAVAVAGILAACRATKQPMASQRILILGAGAAGIGIARLLKKGLKTAGLNDRQAIAAIAIVDSQGLLVDTRDIGDIYKRPFAWPSDLLPQFSLEQHELNDFNTLVEKFKPTVLIGTTGQPDVFSEEIIRTMAKQTATPIILPFSNPTSKSEAKPADLIPWTDGRAYVATGSPFEPVQHNGKTHRIGQGNNVYVFPGIGLGALVANAKSITEGMVFAAANALAEQVTAEELSSGSLYPSIQRLREVTAKVALAVAKEASKQQKSQQEGTSLEQAIDDAMWIPSYPVLELD